MKRSGVDPFFSYENYTHFVRKIMEKRELSLFTECIEQNVILLRHDVDFDVHAALRIAQIENENGAKSTFFFMVSCPFYNLAAQENRTVLQTILSLGHSIGLHFDPMLYPSSDESLRASAKQEADWLSCLSGVAVNAISLHNPSTYGTYPLFDDFINAYDPSIFSNECYLSDSCMDFRGKEPLDFIFSNQSPVIQVLLHPLHFSKQGKGYAAAMSSYIQSQVNSINEGLSINKRFRAEFPSGIKLPCAIEDVG